MKYAYTTHIRDGAYGQINAGYALHLWNQKKGRQMLQAKTSAGCSMTEATNDLGHMHDILHKLVSHKDFKCKQSPDPKGPLYSTVKTYLQTYMKPASFRTYWKFICRFQPFIFKAFTTSNVLSALELGGFHGDKIDIPQIMSHNHEFCKIQPSRKAEEVISLIETVFTDYWAENGLIHENIFDEIFAGEKNIDQLNNRVGKPLNELGTNRQRFMMDNHTEWIAEIARRKEQEALGEIEKARKRQAVQDAVALKPKLQKSCKDPSCPNKIDVSTAALKRTYESSWTYCTGKGCKTWCCQDHADTITRHMTHCEFVAADI